MKNVLLLLMLAFSLASNAQSEGDTILNIYLANDSFLVTINQDSNGVTPVFTDTNINNFRLRRVFTA